MDGDMVVFTEQYHLQRGKCCNNNCKHCPYKKTKTMEQSLTGEKVMSFGEQLVGLTFNPSGDPKVNRAKELCAELADLIQADNLDRRFSDKPGSELYQQLLTHAVGEILNAQMNVVKILTFKY